MKTMNKKHILIAAAVAGIAILAGGAMLSSAGKKQALGYYDELKEQFALENVLSEGDISYSFWSGNVTVESPEIRLVALQTNGAEKFLKGIMGLMGEMASGTNETGLVAWSRYLLASATGGGNAGGAYLNADALKVSRDGDNKKGEIHVQLLGMDMGTPYLSHKGSDVVLPAEVADEIQPRSEIDQYGSVVKSPYSWGSNMVQRLPFTGAFITGATGEFGTKVDLDFTLQRSSDGEGSIKFVVVHRNDGSEIGRIVREAKFASLPELDEVQAQLKTAFNGFIMGAYSASMGQAVIAEAASDFARKTKVASYSLTYKGFDQLKEGFDEYKTATKGQEFAGYCAEAGFSAYQSDFGAKAKNHSDSECAIAQKLVTDGKFVESYEFKEDKSLFAGLFVSKSFTLETN
ncbi:hypothetical protein [Pseudomonas sp. GM55]|jgi:hypothetical protein|uniref:hypothetical protein n=1 Tax=Pseudomonas sp. GM55 TaxID=1144333 RepID=UPI000270702B|nr:hypothetical protein [Pseudomonas sp. GM55]EJM65034.1 hypothetical protein PMI31_05835 [Pseudomonas sp. GM55]